MPTGRPKRQTGVNGKAMSKMNAVRRALAELGSDAKPLQIREFVKKFGVAMKPGVISSYKNHLSHGSARRKAAGKRKTATAGTKGGISLEQIKAVKALADQIGADKVRELAEVLAK